LLPKKPRKPKSLQLRKLQKTPLLRSRQKKTQKKNCGSKKRRAHSLLLL